MKKWCWGVLGLVLSHWVSASPSSYSQDIQPIFTQKCVACHACYDSPCQLNLGSGEGLERGAHKEPIYNGGRSTAQQTTRLFIDAQSTDAWRKKVFFDVLGEGQPQASLLVGMLELGRQQPFASNSRLPDDLIIGIDRKDQCTQPHEFARFAQENPHSGMPYCATSLTDAEYASVKQWLQDGAQIDWQPWTADSVEQQQIEQWKTFFNAPGARENLVSR